MLKNETRQLILVIAINVTIALGFFIGNLNANYSSLSSDIQNIIPVAQKFDNPELFKKDLYLNTIDNVRYYTPFYVQSLRFFGKFTNQDYVQSVNIMNGICHLLFGVLWFFLIYKFVSNFWIALLISVLVRGIVWLPGFEIWGIADLWTMMPRTLYITFFPIPFLILKPSFLRVVLSAFLIGLVFNFHPITGLGGILLYLSFIVLYVIVYKQKSKVTVKNSLGVLLALLIGMLPFILTYFGKTSSNITYDMNAFSQAFNARIPMLFSEPITFLKQWVHFKTLFYILPVILYYLVSRSHKESNNRAKIIILLTVILIVLPSISVYVEGFVNRILNLNLRLSFQLIRSQKIAIIPSFFAMAYLLQYLHEKLKSNWFLPVLVSTCFLVLLVCKRPVFDAVPFVGDDISRLVLPNNLSFGSHLPSKKLAADAMAEYIEENTPQEALLYGSHHYRGASRRSVILDSKGASMLIEGNPTQFIEARENQKKLGNAQTIIEKIKVLKTLGVNYIVTRNKAYGSELTPVHTEGDLSLYKL
ncbi:hypothetical protein [Lacinutrix sp. Hel_I_90]|uniref:hypothetical protein n=1 Tax=Lacinutrix sp. Hel_I_90 TaxID=1249999 RepID=UPI0005CA6C99|nr:hypothetical protein [Lacinutrix sp. Hel_I_90]